MEDWGSDGCLRWHFPRLWSPSQASCHSNPTSCQVVFPLTSISFSHACSLGRLSSSTFLRSCLLNSHFGIALACWRDKAVVESSLISPHSFLSYLSYKERLERLKLPTLKYRHTRGGMIEVYKMLMNKYDSNVNLHLE